MSTLSIVQHEQVAISWQREVVIHAVIYCGRGFFHAFCQTWIENFLCLITLKCCFTIWEYQMGVCACFLSFFSSFRANCLFVIFTNQPFCPYLVARTSLGQTSKNGLRTFLPCHRCNDGMKWHLWNAHQQVKHMLSPTLFGLTQLVSHFNVVCNNPVRMQLTLGPLCITESLTVLFWWSKHERNRKETCVIHAWFMNNYCFNISRHAHIYPLTFSVVM